MTDATPSAETAPTASPEVREHLVEALNLDLIGPWSDHALADECLPGRVRPTSWYLGGFIAPAGSRPEDRGDSDENDDIDEIPKEDGPAEESVDEGRPAKKSFFPSSVGLSFLVPKGTDALGVTVRWGDYRRSSGTDEDGKTVPVWRRHPREQVLRVSLPPGNPFTPLPESGGIGLFVSARSVASHRPEKIPDGTQAVSVFVVNRRKPNPDDPDTAFAFQVGIEVRSDRPFAPRPDMRGTETGGWDEQMADLHYADTPEYATGHGVSADWEIIDGECRVLRTRWIPGAVVEKTETTKVTDAELSMERLGRLPDGQAVKSALTPLVDQYRAWIVARRPGLGSLPLARKETAEELLRLADLAADRIRHGVDILAEDADALDAFRVANRSVAAALRQRLRRLFKDASPSWRAFQLAFILLNIPGIADPRDPHRKTVDLLFFPTGGGKTEAYLGLAAFTMVLRRLRNPGQEGCLGAGVAVIMRYTLRLLTLDQLSRASGLVCALELERQANIDRYGWWPFEIGLWVGKAATPNRLGRRNDQRSDSARSKIRRFKAEPNRRPSPIPLENCPWCGTRFTPDSFNLWPNEDHPQELRIACANFECEFSGDRPLPIQAVDDTIYRRLPAFLIATVDKFAALPWTAETGKLLGRASNFDKQGFYGAEAPEKGTPLGAMLPPPDLVIQDEMHLISGPLGTMVGLYETSIEALCARKVGDKAILPKIVASTATVRRAQDQIQALFARPATQVFPPSGPDRRDSFFARTVPVSEAAGRQYIGIVAPGRNIKVLLRRVWLVLMAAAERMYRDAGGNKNTDNPADPYMTVLGYFNSLRELGGARRILEEQVHNTVQRYGERTRVGERHGLLQNRKMISDVMELTSRIPTDRVASARRRLECPFHEKERVDCAIATNMISVGLDITRLGLMVVMGQPKTHAEYIQATSRVGRDDKRPGLVVTLLNMHKPRDRSHYEGFRHYHETFYRSVEVSSVTPFSARALDRGLAGALVAYARHAESSLTPPGGAAEIAEVRQRLEERLRHVYRDRVGNQPLLEEEIGERSDSVRHRIGDLLDSWREVVADYSDKTVNVLYQKHETPEARGRPLLRDMLEQEFDTEHQRKFRANRSMRTVEPSVDLLLSALNGRDIDPEQ